MASRGELRLVKDIKPASLDDLPEVLTVEEAAAVLRIGRGAALLAERTTGRSALAS